jgi:alpha-beta hydrolase superfamily lysophospholipase
MTVAWDEARDFLPVSGHLLRVAVTLPQGGGPHPAVLLLPPLGARSRTTPLRDAPPNDGLASLVRALAGAGIATLRVDPAGVGESGGPPYEDADLDGEVAGYRAARAMLAALPGVDPARVFLLGVSLGGTLAPIVARGGGAAGVVIYGATSRRWSECLADSARRQLVLGGASGEALAREADHARELYARLLRDGWSPERTFRERPELARCRAAADVQGERLHGRSIAYFRALDGVDPERAWGAVGAPVLALRGEHDWIVADDDPDRIAGWVRAAGGRAEARVLPGLDHDLLRQPSLAASFAARGRGSVDGVAAGAVIDWVRAAAGEASGFTR